MQSHLPKMELWGFEVVVIFIASLAPGNLSSLVSSRQQDADITASSSDHHLLTCLLSDLLDREKPNVILVLAHDYQTLPDYLTGLFQTLSRPYIPINILPAPDATIPEERVNLTTIHYWFSWLQHPEARSVGQCTLFIAVICHPNNLETLLELTASRILMKPSEDRLFLWTRDEQADEMTLLMHDHVYLFKNKILARTSSSQSEQDEAVLKTLCFFCDKGQPSIVVLDRYQVGMNASELPPDLFPDTTKNFHGRFMHGVFIEPFSPASLREKRAIDAPVFVQEAIQEAIAESLNFDWEVLALDMGEEGVVETQLDDGTWMGMVGEILYKRADFGPATIYSEKAIRVVDYPVAFYEDYVTYLTRSPMNLYSAKVIVQPYTYDMWALLLVATVIVGIVYFVFLRTLLSIHDPFSKRRPKSLFSYAMQLVVLALIEEGPDYFPDSVTARIFAGFWWLVAMVISCGYNSKLVAFLAMPEKEQLPQNGLQLITRTGWRWGAMHLHALFYDMLVENSSDETLKNLGPKLESLASLEDCVTMTLEGDFACFSLRIFLQLVSYHFIDKDGTIPFQHAKERTLDIMAGFVLPKYFVATPAFSAKVRGMLEGGLVIHYEAEMNFYAFMIGLSSARHRNRVKEDSLALNWKQMQGPLLILSAGWAVGLLVFIAENVSRKSKKSKINVSVADG